MKIDLCVTHTDIKKKKKKYIYIYIYIRKVAITNIIKLNMGAGNREVRVVLVP